VDALVSYQNAVMKPVSTTPGEFPMMGLEGSSDPVQGLAVPGLDSNEPRNGRDYCAQSETAVEAHGEDERWHMPQRDDILVRNFTPVRDEPTTVSALSQREPEELATLREERNTFRDMCLTLGAEVAKLKNILAAQKGIYMEHRGHEYLAAHSTYNPEFMQTDFHGITKATTIGATSDAGIHRGDHESARSEDGTDHATHDYTGSRLMCMCTNRHQAPLRLARTPRWIKILVPCPIFPRSYRQLTTTPSVPMWQVVSIQD
jgi:hypothetical protein